MNVNVSGSRSNVKQNLIDGKRFVDTHIFWLAWCIYLCYHDDVIICKLLPRCWPFLGRLHRSPVNSLHKGQWRGALMVSLMGDRTNGWVNNRDIVFFRCHRTHYDVIVMFLDSQFTCPFFSRCTSRPDTELWISSCSPWLRHNSSRWYWRMVGDASWLTMNVHGSSLHGFDFAEREIKMTLVTQLYCLSLRLRPFQHRLGNTKLTVYWHILCEQRS